MRHIPEVCAIFFACFLVTIDGQTPSVRSSYCRRPDLLPLVCSDTCVDIDCVGGQLCCPNLCGNGRRVCSDPLYCPPISSTPPAAGACTLSCNNNVDCTGGLICCVTGCSTPQCVVPFTTTVAPPTSSPSSPTPSPTPTTSPTPTPSPTPTSAPTPPPSPVGDCFTNGCPTGYLCSSTLQCILSNGCISTGCPAGYFCSRTSQLCVVYTTSSPLPSTSTPSSTFFPPPLTTDHPCRNFQCASDEYCRPCFSYDPVYCRYGPSRVLPRAVCMPIFPTTSSTFFPPPVTTDHPCRNFQCASDEFCRPCFSYDPVYCRDEPSGVLPRAVCMPTTTRPPPFTTTTRPPPSTCANANCPQRTICELQEVQCEAPPCFRRPVCVPDRCFGILCGPNEYCQDGICTSDCYPFNTDYTELCGERDQPDSCPPEEVCLTSTRTGLRVCCPLPADYRT